MSVPVLKQRNNFILIILVLLAICIAIGLNRITSGFLGAIIIYVIFRPLNIYLQEKKKWNKSLSTALILILSFVSLIIPIFFIIKLITDRVMFYVNNPEQTKIILQNINTFAAEKL